MSVARHRRALALSLTIMWATAAAPPERVRLFEPADLAAMVLAAGFTVTDVLGDFAGGTLTPQSPRAIIFAQRPATHSYS